MKYESQKIAYASFVTAMILFVVQVSGGLLAGWIYVSPNTFAEILPFNVVRMLHTNSLIVWLLTGFFGAAYFLDSGGGGTRDPFHTPRISVARVPRARHRRLVVTYVFELFNGNLLLG